MNELERLRAENWEMILKIIDMERGIESLSNDNRALELENQYLRERVRRDTARHAGP